MSLSCMLLILNIRQVVEMATIPPGGIGGVGY